MKITGPQIDAAFDTSPSQNGNVVIVNTASFGLGGGSGGNAQGAGHIQADFDNPDDVAVSADEIAATEVSRQDNKSNVDNGSGTRARRARQAAEPLNRGSQNPNGPYQIVPTNAQMHAYEGMGGVIGGDIELQELVHLPATTDPQPQVQQDQAAAVAVTADAAASPSSSRRGLATGLSILGGVLLVSGSFLWAFLAGAGRKRVVGPFKLKALDPLNQNACPSDATVAIDVQASCEYPEFLDGSNPIRLQDPTDQSWKSAVTTSDGTWSVIQDANKYATVQLTRSTTVVAPPVASIAYQLNGSGDGLDVSDTAHIKITFTAGPTKTTTATPTVKVNTASKFVASAASPTLMVMANVITADNSMLPAGTEVAFHLTASGATTPVLATASDAVNSQVSVAVPTTAGTYDVTAFFVGTCALATSTSPALTIAVTPTAPTTTSFLKPATASISKADQTVIVTVIVTVDPDYNLSPTAGTVTVTLTDSSGTTQIGNQATATVTSSSTPVSVTVPGGTAVGTYTLTASYSGDTATGLAKSDPKNSTGTTLVLSDKLQTTTSLNLPNPATLSVSSAAQTVSVSAIIAPPSGTTQAITGSVTFTLADPSTTPATTVASASGNVSLDATSKMYQASGILTVPANTVAKQYQLTAAYGGDSNYDASNDNAMATTFVISQPTTITLAHIGNLPYSTAAQNVAVSAVVTLANGTAAPPTTGSVTFSLTLAGSTTPYSISAPIPLTGTMASTMISVPAPSTASGATYTVSATFTGSLYTTKSASQTFAINPIGAPVVTLDPMSQSVPVGSTATFTAAATNNPTVQWQVSTDGGMTFSNISGATSTSLTLNNVTQSMSGYQYLAVFTNMTGNQSTKPATLMVTAATNTPGFTLQPVNMSALTVTVTPGGNPGISTINIVPSNGFASAVTLGVANVPMQIVASYTTMPTTSYANLQFFFSATSIAALGTYTITLTGTDSTGTITASLDITLNVQMATMMLARHFLSSANMTRGRTGGFDVTTRADSTHGIDPASVRLTGIQHVGGKAAATQAILRKDGKIMLVPGEGVWMVDNSGVILFNADNGLLDPPTPPVYTVSDVHGNVSNEVFLVIDESLSHANTVTQTMRDQSDAEFWKAFTKHAIDDPAAASDELDLQTLLVAVVTSAQICNAVLVIPGPEPVTAAEFDKALQKWDMEDPSDLVTICKNLIDKAIPEPARPLKRRFWRLTLMTRMIIKAIQAGG